MRLNVFACLRLLLVLGAVLCVPSAALPLRAQAPAAVQAVEPAQPATPAPTPEVSDDPLGRGTPHGTVLGFVKAANRGDYDEAALYLDTKQHGDLARDLAQQLKTVLDHETSIDLSQLSRKPEGSQSTAQKSTRELVGVAVTSTGKLQIWLDRVQRNDEPAIWLFSEDTLRDIPDAYESFTETTAAGQHMPQWLQFDILAVPLWRWLGLLVAVPLILLLGSWLNHLLRPIFIKLAHRVAGEKALDKVHSIRAPLCLLLFGLLFLALGATSSSLLGRAFWRDVGSVVTVLAVTWFVTRIVGLISELSVGRLKRLQSSDQIALAGLLGRLAQIGAVIIGALVILQMRGVNLTAALTGLGIGGLAVAFAAQKTLENLFGGIMIISDHPLRIGDLCRIGAVEGYVMDIGLRSTRIRTFNRTIVTIPNGQLSTLNIENLTLRDKYWFHHVVTLRYDSTAAQIQAVLKGIRRLLEVDDRVETSTARVAFIAIGSVSQDIEIFSYVFAENSTRFLETQESLLLEILKIVESTGAEFSLPTQVTKVEAPAERPGNTKP